MTETTILFAIRAALVGTGRVLIWRNSTGVDRERWVKYGLGVGGADLVGILKPGRFLAVEVKTPAGRLSKEQRLWRDAVLAAGGVYFVARSADEALAQLGDIP